MRCNFGSMHTLKCNLQEALKKGIIDGVPLDELIETDYIKEVFNEIGVPFDYGIEGTDDYKVFTFGLGKYSKKMEVNEIIDQITNTTSENPDIEPTKWTVNIAVDFITGEIDCAFVVFVDYTDTYESRHFDCPIELHDFVLIEGNK